MNIEWSEGIKFRDGAEARLLEEDGRCNPLLESPWDVVPA